MGKAFVRVLPESAATSRTGGQRAVSKLELPEGLVPLLDEGVTEDGIPNRIYHEENDSVMVLIPEGIFVCGTDTGPADAGPRHSAFVSAFYIDQTEVTVDRFRRFIAASKETKTSFLTAKPPVNNNGSPNEPALGISWRDASNYAKFYGLDLPTEAEWEKAGRGPQGYTYPWGNGRPIWSGPRRRGEAGPVQSFPSDRSQYDVWDLAGNAREWVGDWYAANAHSQAMAADGTPIRNWSGPKRSDVVSHRVIKGGTEGWELWRRSHSAMKDHVSDVGFRCVLRVTDKMILKRPAPTRSNLPPPSSRN